jgi:hypothetical protein
LVPDVVVQKLRAKLDPAYKLQDISEKKRKTRA